MQRIKVKKQIRCFNSYTSDWETVFDKGGSGSFGLPEIRHVLTNLGADLSEDEIEEMLREIDIDGDDVISFKGTNKNVAHTVYCSLEKDKKNFPFRITIMMGK